VGGGAVFAEAARLGVELTVGIEMDVLLDGREVHLLAYGLDAAEPRLATHLEAVAAARRERTRREIDLVNALLGADAIRGDEVFVPGRESFMRPHLIRPLVERGYFASYGEGRAWFAERVGTGVVVPKPTLGEAIAMVRAAGGWTSLAHPGYYWKDGDPILERLDALREMGLDAVELDYPYRSCSPDLFSDADEAGFRAALRAQGERLGLRFTRGSDSHRLSDLERVYGPAPA